MNKILFVLLLLSAPLLAQKELIVASYNLRMDTPKDGPNAWPNRKEMVKELIKYHEFDIFGTQEGFIHQLNDISELKEYAFTGSGRGDGKQAGEHSAIFYRKKRFKLLDSGDFWLSEDPDKPGKGWDATCCNRIASWGKFKDLKTKKTFYFFNVHFDHQGIVARRESGQLMISKIQEIAGKFPVILTGDFNSLPETDQIKAISGLLKDAYTSSIAPPYGPVGTANSFKLDAPLKNRIDYIFVSGTMEVLKYASLTDHKDQRYPSDHLPIAAKIRF